MASRIRPFWPATRPVTTLDCWSDGCLLTRRANQLAGQQNNSAFLEQINALQNYHVTEEPVQGNPLPSLGLQLSRIYWPPVRNGQPVCVIH